MARFCPNCGTPAEEGCAFCMECGTPIPQDEAFPAAPAPAAEESFTPAPAKPMKKSTKIALIVVASVAVVLFAVSQIFGGIYSTDSVSEKFLTALEEGNFAALAKSAETADETIILSEENTAPLFALCEKSPNTLSGFEEMLAENGKLAEKGKDQNTNYPLTFNVSNWVLFKAYKVCINPCTVQVETNLVGTEVTLGGITATAVEGYASFDHDIDFGFNDSAAADSGYASSDDPSVIYMDGYYDSETSVATISGLLPGIYDLTCSYTNVVGETMTYTDTVKVSEPEVISYANIDYTMASVYNPYDYEVEVSVNDSVYGTLAPQTTLVLSPISYDAYVSFTCSPDGTNVFEDYFYVSDSNYHEIYFESCAMYFYNYNDFAATPVITTASGTTYDLSEVGADDYGFFNLLAVGSQVSSKPSGTEGYEFPGLASSVLDLETSNYYDYSAYFYLDETETANFTEYLSTYFQQLVTAARDGDTGYFEQITRTNMSQFASSYLVSSFANYAIEGSIEIPAEAQVNIELTGSYDNYYVYVRPQYTINLVLTGADGTTYNESYQYRDYFYYYDGAWHTELPV